MPDAKAAPFGPDATAARELGEQIFTLLRPYSRRHKIRRSALAIARALLDAEHLTEKRIERAHRRTRG